MKGSLLKKGDESHYNKCYLYSTESEVVSVFEGGREKQTERRDKDLQSTISRLSKLQLQGSVISRFIKEFMPVCCCPFITWLLYVLLRFQVDKRTAWEKAVD